MQEHNPKAIKPDNDHLNLLYNMCADTNIQTALDRKFQSIVSRVDVQIKLRNVTLRPTPQVNRSLEMYTTVYLRTLFQMIAQFGIVFYSDQIETNDNKNGAATTADEPKAGIECEMNEVQLNQLLNKTVAIIPTNPHLLSIFTTLEQPDTITVTDGIANVLAGSIPRTYHAHVFERPRINRIATSRGTHRDRLEFTSRIASLAKSYKEYIAISIGFIRHLSTMAAPHIIIHETDKNKNRAVEARLLEQHAGVQTVLDTAARPLEDEFSRTEAAVSVTNTSTRLLREEIRGHDAGFVYGQPYNDQTNDWDGFFVTIPKGFDYHEITDSRDTLTDISRSNSLAMTTLKEVANKALGIFEPSGASRDPTRSNGGTGTKLNVEYVSAMFRELRSTVTDRNILTSIAGPLLNHASARTGLSIELKIITECNPSTALLFDSPELMNAMNNFCAANDVTLDTSHLDAKTTQERANDENDKTSATKVHVSQPHKRRKVNETATPSVSK